MNLIPFSLKESFDQQNPVNRLYGKLIPLWKAKGADGFLTLCVQFSLLIAVAWGVSLSFALNGVLDRFVNQWYINVANISLLLLLIPAFLAPAAGAAIRNKLDNSPLIKEILATSLKPREYAAAMHGRVLYPSLVAVLLMGSVVLGVYGMWLLAPAVHSDVLRQALLRMFYWPMDPEQYPMSGGVIWYGIGPIALLVMAVNYGAGIYLRMTMLCCIPQNSENARSRGSSLTLGLVLAMVVSICFRLLVINMFVLALRTNGLDGGPVAVVLIETPVLFFRYFWARKHWVKMLDKKTGLEAEFREYILKD